MKGALQHKKKIQIVCIAALCTTCFGLGALAPKAISMLNRNNVSGLKKVEKVYSMLENDWYYADQVEDIDELLSEQALMGMTSLEKDPHTNYFNLEQAKIFQQSLSGSQVGIGFNFYVQEDGNLNVRHVYIHSAAETAGLQSGDIITVIGNKICAETPSDEIIEYIQQHDGKPLTLHILRDGMPKQLKVVPGHFDSTVVCQIHDEFGEIILSSFSEFSGQDFADAVERLKDAEISNLIIDLRGNTGGYLSAVIDIASTLLPKDSVVFKECLKNGKVKEYTVSEDFEYTPFEQIVLLQNENSASASEVLIGALKDNLPENVTTVGTKTYGKGTEQVTVPFKDGTSIKYTVAEWKTPKGTSINQKGFEPDIEVEGLPVQNVKYKEMEKEEVIEPDTVHVNARAVQTFLQYLGYDIDRTDTYFSLKSSEALRQFQKDYGMNATGIVDQKTWEQLEKVMLLKMNQNEENEDRQRQRAIEVF